MTRFRSVLSIMSAALLFGSLAQAAGSDTAAAELQRARVSADAKLHPLLRVIAGAQRDARSRENLLRRMPQLAGPDVAINVVVDGDARAVASQLRSLGMANPRVFGSMVSGRMAVSGLKAAATLSGVHTVRPALARTHSGLVNSQGDRAQRSSVARMQFGVDGRGVKVGVLSDSFTCLQGPIFPDQPFTTMADDIRNGDLPANTKVLSEQSPCSGADEGRAMAQIIHDVAPGASIMFHTAFNGEADFAQGIIDLADAGANIIVDDVGYFDEPMMQDGIVAQAVDAVKARGVAYFSSAGNDARASYESVWRSSKSVGASGLRHNFASSGKPDPLQTITLTNGALEAVFLNWDQPFRSTGGKGSRSDVDIIYYDMKGEVIPICDDNLQPAVCQFPGATSNIGGDAFEEGDIVNTSGQDVQVQLSIELYAGPAPGYLKYIYFAFGDGELFVDEYDTQSGSSFGHPVARGAMAVGAAAWYNTAPWNVPFHPECRPACLETFSSAGGSPVFFTPAGNRLAQPQIRQKPEVVGPDGGNTSFFYSIYTPTVPGSTEPDQYPNFFGTSASAPHVAALAALMIDKAHRHNKTLTPDRIYGILEQTAQDMTLSAARTIGPFPFPFGGKGLDYDSGYGYVNALAALAAVGN